MTEPQQIEIAGELNVREAESLVTEITEGELKDALLLCKKKKSPGPDGLSYKFYVRCFDLVMNELLAVLNGILSGRLVPTTSWAEGSITLLKKTVQTRNPDDLRPITLLNTDYKLLMKILSLRLKPLMPKRTGVAQSACKDDQNVMKNLKELRYVLTFAEKNPSTRFAIMAADLQQAFDRVDDRYLWHRLRRMNLPAGLILWL